MMVAMIRIARVVMVMRVLRGLDRGLRKPTLHIRNFARRIVEAGVEESRGRRFSLRGIEGGRAGIAPFRPRAPGGAYVGSREIGLGEHEPVGDSRLLHRLAM